MPESAYSIVGTYGIGRKTRTTVYVLPRDGGYWYACDGSQNVNFTDTAPVDGCDVEELQDSDTFTYPDGISSEEELETAVDDN